ncbi:ATP-binding protein [Aphanothece hegewaldii CCALA 016]|uniref:ATP-binding protein n=1 Tax=Aphanothece hegewaldii CCALA 016 TaxID=2107694 RepID=A0A2T1LZX9_9CHRO|nr:ATP-binding protein [Aphanothece hegewaldii]PSF37984.1 ATP-binding protein [Aphanothece hegewaldii CCALA 016]
MERNRPFSPEILQYSTENKLKYFKDVIVPHRNIRIILNQLLKNAIEPDDALVYLVFGVTGVGKSRLKAEFEKRLLKHFEDEITSNPGSLIVGGIEVDAAEGGKFNYSDYYIQVLESLKEVLIEYKENYQIHSEDDNSDYLVGDHEGKNAKALRRALNKVFINRQLKAYTLDEAQHLFDVAGGRQINVQMNWLKSIANKTQTLHVLFGTYDLLKCQEVNGQVGRRSEDFYLPPYYLEKLEDQEEFIRVIKTLQQYLPISDEPQLEEHWKYFMEYSIGCVGILKSWWYRSLKNALDDGAKTVRLKDFKARELSAGRRKKIRDELAEGERRLKNLYTEQKPHKTEPVLDSQASSTKKIRKVGERKVGRDLVGVQQTE